MEEPMNAPSSTGNDVVTGGRWRVTLHVYQGQADRVNSWSQAMRTLEAEWVWAETRRLVAAEGLGHQKALRRASAAAVQLRPERWPVQDALLEQAIRARLAQPDVVDLQGPLEDPEADKALRLPGRRPGSPTRSFPAQIAVTLPVDLVVSGRRAAWRLSGGAEEALRVLIAQYDNKEISQSAYRKARKPVVETLVTWADLVREAIDSHER